MEDWDELENSLFRKGSETKDSGIGEIKKKVAFRDIDENDPLKDLNFSDEEDSEEYFKDRPVVAAQSSKISDLFGLKSEDPPEAQDFTPANALIAEDTEPNNSPLLSTKNSLDKLEVIKSDFKASDPIRPSNSTVTAPKVENPVQKSALKMKSIFDDNDDDHLIDKSKTSVNTQAKKTSLMEDLFGSRPKSSPLIETGRRSNPLNYDIPATRSNSGEALTGLLNESTSKTVNNAGFSLSVPKEPRRGRRALTVQNDPLGLLSMSSLQNDDTPKPKEQKIVQPTAREVIIKSPVIEDLPEWLGGPKVSKEQKQETEKPVQSERSLIAKSAEVIEKTVSGLTDQTVITIGSESEEQQGLTSKLLGIEFDQQAAMINMQQQEHELRTAAVLSQQSEKLNNLLETQKIKLTEQEKQFNMLIARQLERQALLEAQMKAQQDRINSYIQTLSAQPSTVPSMQLTVNKEVKLGSKESEDEKEESESLIQKLQLEKLYLENTLESLREKHEKEISILEESYKKQVQFLEEAMIQMEKRMQDDLECVEADYKLKIQKLRDEVLDTEKLHKTEKQTLKEEHARLIHEIRDNHRRSMEVMQKEHIETIERITKSKESERQAIEIMKLDGTNVENVLNKSQVIIEGLENLQKKFESRDNNFVESQDNHLVFQEKNIEYLKESLEKQKDAFAEEKHKLMVTIQKLESETSELIQEFKKQNNSFKESEEILKSREQALLRDREIFIEQTNWERERLQAMRDAWAKEEDRQLEWLAQERQTLATERGKLQIFNRLKIGVDESSKIELEATIKAAQEAASSANQERLKWQEKINELEIQKNALQEKENNLIQKAKKLDDFTQSAVAIREEGLRALKEARFIEERYKEKFNELQIQQRLLNEREAKLATEKLELAKERLSFRVSEVEQPEKDISNKLDNKIIHEEEQSNFSEVQSTSMQYTTYFKDIVDPHLLLLKWDLDNKLQMSSDLPVTARH
ncbi:hypothetical protein TSAR_009197 [Trichomalopsis sarcophagae]|uniref:Fas-binding factor 1 C-terminal domain-containing protein n=1 Tax=Trichomalopsis sarcophagae TaxID=543379 RepID=A0A232FGM2_9HYME|nr:hypothetical protein TSAR_009197 [Trichomalopsis sarcophagae]